MSPTSQTLSTRTEHWHAALHPAKAMSSCAASSSCGAPQPLEVVLGSINLGIVQTMLSASWSVVSQHISNFQRIVHEQLPQAWNRSYSDEYDENTLNQLAKLPFAQRKRQGASVGAPQPSGMGDEETSRAILGVMKQRQAFLDRKGITGKGYRLTPEERSEMVKEVRDEFEMTEEQLELQLRDHHDRMDALVHCDQGAAYPKHHP